MCQLQDQTYTFVESCNKWAEIFVIFLVGSPGKQRAKAAEVSKFGRAVSNCC